MHFLIYSNSLQEVNTKRLKKNKNEKFTLQYVQFMIPYEEIKFLKMANYITERIASKPVANPRTETMNGTVPVGTLAVMFPMGF